MRKSAMGALLLSVLLAAGGCSAGGAGAEKASSSEAETAQTAAEETAAGETAAAETMAQETAEAQSETAAGQTRDRQAVKAAYVQVLEDLLQNYNLPGIGAVEQPMADEDENLFAVQDVNGDGSDELIIRITNTTMAGMLEAVYGFDEDSKTVRLEYTGFPDLDYYDNGIVKDYSSHNQGLAGRFWPFTLSGYDASSGKYQVLHYVDGWDGQMAAQDPDSGEAFPAGADADKDQEVYYIYDGGWNEQVRPDAVDKKDLLNMLDQEIGDARQVILTTRYITAVNVQKYADQEDLSTVNESADQKEVEFGEIVLHLPADFMDKVTVEQSGSGLNFFQKSSVERAKRGGANNVSLVCCIAAYTKDQDYSKLENYKILYSSEKYTYILYYSSGTPVSPDAGQEAVQEYNTLVDEADSIGVTCTESSVDPRNMIP